MTEEQVVTGCELALKALFFCIFVNAEGRSGEVRDAIRTLFGSEVDEALQRYFEEGK